MTRTMRTCLLVDDSAVSRSAGRQIIETFGFVCNEAADGMQALEHCTALMPDAILLDWNMPRMTGLDFLIRVRRLPQGDKPVIIFCTAQHDGTHITLALSHGADEYVIKPFSPDILRDKFVLTGLLGA